MLELEGEGLWHLLMVMVVSPPGWEGGAGWWGGPWGTARCGGIYLFTAMKILRVTSIIRQFSKKIKKAAKKFPQAPLPQTHQI